MSLATPESVQRLQAALHAKGPDAFSESRMRKIRTSGSMSDLLETEERSGQ
jgi:hypothetical protein